MRRALLLSVLLICAAAAVPFVGAAGATQEDPVTLDVTVVNEDGDPVAGATVNATWDGGNASETTTSSGRTLIDVPRGADVELTIDDDTYTRNFPLRVEDAQPRDVTVEVARKGTATVTVTEQGSTAVPNVTVFVRQDQRVAVRGTTNENGRFSTGTVEQGDYTLILRKPGYYRNETALSIAGTVLSNQEMRQGTVNVEFRVFDDHFENRQAVPNAAVTIEGIGTQRASNGRVTFTVPVNTQQSINVTRAGYEVDEQVISIDESGRTVTVTIQRTPELNVTTGSAEVLVGNRVSVSVVNAYDEPVNGATVTRDGERVGETGANGQTSVRINTTGTHTIRARSGSLTSDPVTVEGVEADRSTPTPTPADTPTDTPTDTPPDTPTATPAVDLPGFTPAVAVLGLLLAALVLSRRD
jgi:PGF-CTERM protein